MIPGVLAPRDHLPGDVAVDPRRCQHRPRRSEGQRRRPDPRARFIRRRAVADAALEAGGEVIGVIPQALVGAEVAHRGLTSLTVVDTMHQRKQAFTDLSDGFITLPGGTGTMDELWEALSWAQIGYHAKPVGLLNVAGFYDGLLRFVETMAEAGFLRAQHRDILIASDDLDDLLAKMAAQKPLETIVQLKASQL